MEVSKNSKLTFSIETLVSLATTLVLVTGVWFTLQADIQEAKELPPPTVSRTEYDLKDKMIRDAVLDTQKDVQEMKEDIKSIETYILNSK